MTNGDRITQRRGLGRPGSWRALSLLVAPLAAVAGPATPPPPGHPIVGVWRWSLPSGCTETYHYRPDGTALAASGKETTESRYTVAPRAAANGGYAVASEVVSGNGRPDCEGKVTKVGSGSKVHVFFSTGRAQIMMCFDATGRQCLGPLTRIDGDPI